MRPIDYFDTAAEANERRIAVIDDDVSLSFGELRALSERVSGLIASRGPDYQRVAIVSPNHHHVLTCTLGAMRAGAAVAPVHLNDDARTKAAFLNEVRPDWIFYHSRTECEMQVVKAQLAQPASWVCLDRPARDAPSLDEVLASRPGAAPDWGDVYGNPQHPVYIRKTSGTTGAPKVLVNDIGSFAAVHTAVCHKLERPGGNPVCLVAAPLSHAAGVHAFSMLMLGGTLVLQPDFDADQVLHSIPKYKVTHMWLPPTALYLLLSCPDVRQFDLSSLRSVMLGAAAVAPEKLREAVSVFGPCVGVNYAQIEGGFLTWLDADDVGAAAAGDHPERLRSSGRSMFVSRVAIMHEDGRLLPPRCTGEIVVRGRSVKPYIDETATAEAHRFRWHHTGDLGYLDEDGYLYVVGRIKDNIITAGFKVSAAEVEQAIMELPEVSECAVVGTPHAVRGEAVTAVVTVRGGSEISPSTVRQHCRTRLGRVKAPLRVEVWPELPKTPVGKVDKGAIREKYGSDTTPPATSSKPSQ
jgi:fatty-acyl-CoA synthase